MGMGTKEYPDNAVKECLTTQAAELFGYAIGQLVFKRLY